MSDLKSSFFSGVFYTGIAKYSGIVFSIIITAILARLISPEDFGIVAIATILVSFFSTLTTVGISPAIVQNKSITDDELRSLNSFVFIFALVVSLLYLAAIPFILRFYDNNHTLEIILLLLVLNVFFSIASIVPNAIILKNKLFKFIAVRTLLIQIVLGVISIVCAYWGMGIYALLVNPIGSSIVLFVVNFMKFPIGFSKVTKEAVNKILSFSVYQTFFNLLYLGYRNVDKLFVGKYFGMETLGYYEKSYRLMMLPLENVSSVVSPVLHPLLSEHQNDYDKIWGVYIMMLKAISEVSLIISVLLFFIAEPLILIFYGKNWLPAVPVFKILSLSICFQMMQVPIGPVLQSINKTRGLFWSSCWLLLFVLFSVMCSAYLGDVIYLAWGIVVSFILGFFVYQIYVARYFGRKYWFVVDILLVPVVSSLVFAALNYILSIFSSAMGCYYSLVLHLLLTILYVLVLCALGFMPQIRDLIVPLLKKYRN